MIKISTEHPSYSPGDAICGQVAWSGLSADRIEVRLIWYTQGKGTRDSMIVDSREIATDQPAGSLDFQFVAPRRPYSFSGKLVSLTWAIEAIAFPQQEAEQWSLVVSPSRSEIQLHTGKELN